MTRGTVESTALIAPEKGTALPVFSGAEMAQALTAYRDLQQALDRAMPDQIMSIDGKPFRRKGYWRALRTAFGLTVECTEERRQEAAEDWAWIVTYRATAPNGRSADGDGSCSASEKSTGRMKPTEHNVRAHAHTRAFNRAVSNLVGFGEVSAEEVLHEARSEQPSGAKPSVISEAQRRRLYALCKKAKREDAEVAMYLHTLGFTSSREISRDRYDAICAVVQAAGSLPLAGADTPKSREPGDEFDPETVDWTG